MEHFHEFDPVAERIIDVDPPEDIQRFIVLAGKACGVETGTQRVEVINHESRMSLGCGVKIGLHAHVQAGATTLKPASVPPGQIGGFWNLGETLQIAEEMARRVLFACRHRQFNMLDTFDRHLLRTTFALVVYQLTSTTLPTRRGTGGEILVKE